MSEELDEYLGHARKIVLPAMKRSKIVSVLLAGDPDPKLCLEVGAAILYEKPLLLLVLKGTIVPDALRRVAEKVVEIDELNAEGRDQAVKAIKEVLENHFPQRVMVKE